MATGDGTKSGDQRETSDQVERVAVAPGHILVHEDQSMEHKALRETKKLSPSSKLTKIGPSREGNECSLPSLAEQRQEQSKDHEKKLGQVKVVPEPRTSIIPDNEQTIKAVQPSQSNPETLMENDTDYPVGKRDTQRNHPNDILPASTSLFSEDKSMLNADEQHIVSVSITPTGHASVNVPTSINLQGSNKKAELYSLLYKCKPELKPAVSYKRSIKHQAKPISNILVVPDQEDESQFRTPIQESGSPQPSTSQDLMSIGDTKPTEDQDHIASVSIDLPDFESLGMTKPDDPLPEPKPGATPETKQGLNKRLKRNSDTTNTLTPNKRKKKK